MLQTLLLKSYWPNQTKWIARTVMVNENKVEESMNILNGIMHSEGMTKRWTMTRRYEVPWKARQRINWEKCRAIYNEDMKNRIDFLVRKNRKNPYPGYSADNNTI